MSKTADVLREIWSEEWFLDLSPDGQHVYLWAITCGHTNPAGLFVAARKLIRFETNLSAKRLDAALAELGVTEKLLYDAEHSVVWVRGQVKRTRSKTVPMAKSIAAAVAGCQSERLRRAFLARYADTFWAELRTRLADVHANPAEVHQNPQSISGKVNLSRTPAGVQGQGLGQGLNNGGGQQLLGARELLDLVRRDLADVDESFALMHARFLFADGSRTWDPDLIRRKLARTGVETTEGAAA